MWPERVYNCQIYHKKIKASNKHKMNGLQKIMYRHKWQAMLKCLFSNNREWTSSAVGTQTSKLVILILKTVIRIEITVTVIRIAAIGKMCWAGVTLTINRCRLEAVFIKIISIILICSASSSFRILNVKFGWIWAIKNCSNLTKNRRSSWISKMMFFNCTLRF